jgi:hypothetical protein
MTASDFDCADVNSLADIREESIYAAFIAANAVPPSRERCPQPFHAGSLVRPLVGCSGRSGLLDDSPISVG